MNCADKSLLKSKEGLRTHTPARWIDRLRKIRTRIFFNKFFKLGKIRITSSWAWPSGFLSHRFCYLRNRFYLYMVSLFFTLSVFTRYHTTGLSTHWNCSPQCFPRVLLSNKANSGKNIWGLPDGKSLLVLCPNLTLTTAMFH